MIQFIRRYKRILFLILDVVILILAAWLSFVIRFDGHIPSFYVYHLYALTLLSLVISLPIFYWQKVYHFTWRFVGLSDLYQLIKAVTFSNVLTIAILFVLRDVSILGGFPRSTVIINYFLTIILIGGLRIAKRLFQENIKRFIIPQSGRKTVIIGAGGAGEELLRSVVKTPGYNLVGLIDDADNKQNTLIHGYVILGRRQDIPAIHEKIHIDEIIIAIPSAGSRIIQETVEICRRAGIPKIKILPSIQEIIDGHATLDKVREISIVDLLGREPVKIDTTSIQKFIFGKRVLVTGGAGSIGSRLCQQILKFQPEKLIAIDQNETGIFHLERNLNKEFPTMHKVFEVGDICDLNKIDWLFKKNHPQVVLHAAAYKHVPVMEAHPLEAVKNNVFGTLSLAKIALKYGVEKFVFISTDKAINPTSVMGATKRIGEMLGLWLNQEHKTKFCSVRFGNVLDSQGNVVGIFEEQIKRGGPVEITHPEMKRFFMVTSEACLLVLQAGAISQGGEVFVLDMGEPIKIVDLAKEMIRLAGYRIDVDIPIVFSQMRPGEKLFEEILTHQEKPTKHEKIFVANLESVNFKQLESGLTQLESALAQMKQEDIIRILEDLVSGYKRTK